MPSPDAGARRKRTAATALAIAGVAAVVALLALYAFADPADPALPFPKCLLLTLTGWQCPGCGSQRALHALLGGDVAAAWGYNALLVLFLPLIALLGVAEMMRKRAPRFHAAMNSRPVILGVLAAVLLWWVGRNLI